MATFSYSRLGCDGLVWLYFRWGSCFVGSYSVAGKEEFLYRRFEMPGYAEVYIPEFQEEYVEAPPCIENFGEMQCHYTMALAFGSDGDRCLALLTCRLLKFIKVSTVGPTLDQRLDRLVAPSKASNNTDDQRSTAGPALVPSS
jgi:hypothetical protein